MERGRYKYFSVSFSPFFLFFISRRRWYIYVCASILRIVSEHVCFLFWFFVSSTCEVRAKTIVDAQTRWHRERKNDFQSKLCNEQYIFCWFRSERRQTEAKLFVELSPIQNFVQFEQTQAYANQCGNCASRYPRAGKVFIDPMQVFAHIDENAGMNCIAFQSHRSDALHHIVADQCAAIIAL